jgi:transcriptional regulator with XRE-family HTH domain
MSTKQLRTVTSYPAIVGQVLTELRRCSGIDQSKLADSVGVTQSTWSRIENGASALTIEQLAIAADVLGVKRSEILELADQSVNELKIRGIEIEDKRISGGLDKGLVILGAAAIGGLIAALLMKK